MLAVASATIWWDETPAAEEPSQACARVAGGQEMLEISSEQIRALAIDWRNRLRSERVDEITAQLEAHGGERVQGVSRAELRVMVGEVLDAAANFGVHNPEHLVNWAYIRLVVGGEFYEMPEFKDVLEHPYLHGDAKGRHVVMSFFAVNKMLGRAR